MHNLVDLKALEREERLENFHVALIDCNPESLAIYEKQIVALSRVSTTRLLLDDLHEQADAAATLAHYDLIVTTSTHYAELCGMFPRAVGRMVQAVVSPRQETLIDLARIGSSQAVGVMCQSDTFLRIIRDKLQDLHIPSSRVTHLSTESEGDLGRFLRACNVVVVPPGYSLVRRREHVADVQAFRAGGGKVIVFDYQIERGSMLQIEDRIRTLLNQ